MAGLMLVNPRKRRTVKRKKNPIAKRKTRTLVAHKKHSKIKRYRRNPIGGRAGGMIDQVKTAAIGAVGALAVDIAMAKLPIPLSMQTGVMRNVAQGAVSIGLGMLVSKLGKNKSLGVKLAEGGLTIAMHGALKSMLAGKIDGLSGYQDLSGDLLGMGDLLGAEGFDDNDGGVGWNNPAATSMSGFDQDSGYNY